MAHYKVEFKASAAKEFRKLTSEIKARIRKAINALQTDHLPTGVRKLAGETNLYRIRVGDFRVIYAIDNEAKVLVIMRVRHRRDVYQ
ncbi:MAG: type II toxin-antitoxin system RelE/ParE family toxin [Tildeniella torsiva UHER 1998/13D]|jgi:mRNA interferase RelE/StbE|nr:type II toxin-antitoxin system RelE/ParE family toxin [Tildeniella torsiva UHER 1998/13D]